MNTKKIYFAWALALLVCVTGIARQIEVEASSPRATRPGRFFRDFRVRYKNPALPEGSKVQLHYAYRMLEKKSSFNPAEPFTPTADASHWCSVLIAQDWQRETSVELKQERTGDYVVEVPVSIEGRGDAAFPSQLQFFVSIERPDGSTVIDRPSGWGTFYFVEIPVVHSVSSDPSFKPWERMPLLGTSQPLPRPDARPIQGTACGFPAGVDIENALSDCR